MQVTVVMDHKFAVAPDGGVYARTMFGPKFWERYLAVFDRVVVVARLRSPARVDESFVRTDSRDVQFTRVPYYEGPYEYARNYHRIRQAVRQSVCGDNALILRLPQTLPILAGKLRRQRSAAFGVELVGDPWDLYSPSASSTLVRPYVRWRTYKNVRTLCAASAATSYVTENTLQESYPSRRGVRTWAISSVELATVAETSRPPSSFAGKIRLICVGTMNQRYKGYDTLIRAFAGATESLSQLELVLVGDGQLRSNLEELARACGVSEKVHFRGELSSGPQVVKELDHAHLFVLPSRQEGLPRAMIEASARGLPCIGSRVGGIPELLPRECLVEPNDERALTRAITTIASNPSVLSALSARGIRRATDFLDRTLDARRFEFYSEVRDKTKEWKHARATAGPAETSRLLRSFGLRWQVLDGKNRH
jgi:glycosyltransferase involved in cell wall biosynthesis